MKTAYKVAIIAIILWSSSLNRIHNLLQYIVQCWESVSKLATSVIKTTPLPQR